MKTLIFIVLLLSSIIVKSQNYVINDSAITITKTGHYEIPSEP